MEESNKVECNNCEWTGYEDDLSLIMFDANDEEETPTSIEDNNGSVKKILEDPQNKAFLKGCPNCLTDGYLKDIW